MAVEQEIVWLLGNTRYLTAKFTDTDGTTPVEVDPNSVKFIVYDNNFTQVKQVSVPDSAKVSVGQYSFNYVPDTAGSFVVEYYGTVSGLPTLHRDKVKVVKVD